jgi:hypothetical protein
MPVDQIVRTLGVNWPHLIAQTISFTLVCALLFGFGTPLMETLEARRQQMLGPGEYRKNQRAAGGSRRVARIARGRSRRGGLHRTDARIAARRLTEQEAARAKTWRGDSAACPQAAEEERRRLMADTGKPLSDADQRRLARGSVAAGTTR